MKKKKIRFPAYATVIGHGTDVNGTLHFFGGLHVDGRIVGDVEAEGGASGSGSALTLGTSGVIEGNLTVPHVVIDGTVVGDVRAALRAELASGARIQGTVYYGLLEMDEGAEVNGKLVHISDAEESTRPQSGKELETGDTAGQAPGPEASPDISLRSETDGNP